MSRNKCSLVRGKGEGPVVMEKQPLAISPKQTYVQPASRLHFLSPHPSISLPSITLYGMEYPFGQSGLALQAASPPNFLLIPGLV